MTAEKWLAIPNYEGAYEVSDKGRVRSLPRTVERASRWGPVVARLRGRIIKPHTQNDGYERVCLSDGGQRRTVLVHRLVLSAFAGECPAGLAGLHRNQARADNRAENLRWGRRKSQREAAAA